MVAKVLLSILLLPLMIAVALPSFAEDPNQTAEEIINSVFSPFCAGRMLNDCPSSASDELEKKIEAKVANGESKEEILKWLYQLYGDDIRALPKADGIGMSAWLMPIIFLVIGLLGMIFWMRSRFNQYDRFE